MGKAILSYYLNFFNFRGRTSKESFRQARKWVVGSKLGLLVILIVYLIANVGDRFFDAYAVALVAYPVWWGLHIIPSMALGVRRYHDVGLRGWGYLWEKLLWYLIFFISRVPSKTSETTSTDGEPQENKYGPVPVD